MNYSEQPSKIQSVRLASTAALTIPLELRWVWRSGQRSGDWLGFTSSAVVVGGEGKIHRLELEGGQLGWCLDGLVPIGFCADLLLAHKLGASSHQVQAYDLEGRRLWTVSTSRPVATRYCVGRDGFYAWPGWEVSRSSRLSADFHPLHQPDRPCELEGPRDYVIDRMCEQDGWLACYRWGEGPGHCAVYHNRQLVWINDRQGSNTPEIWADETGWVMCTLETSQSWSSQGEARWSAPGLRRRWMHPDCLLGEGADGVVAIDRGSGASQTLLAGGIRDLTLAGDQVWWLNWESFGCQSWTYPLATLGLWAQTANRLVAHGGRLYLCASDGSVACFGPAA